MKAKQYSSLLLLLPLFTESFAQDIHSNFLKEVFKSVQQKDTAAFLRNNMSHKDLREIVKLATSADSITEPSQPPGKSVEKMHEEFLLDSSFNKLINEAKSLGLDLSKSVYHDCKYQVLKDPSILIPSLTGSVYFKKDSTLYELKVREALWIDGKWKVNSFGDISVLNDSILYKTTNSKLSAFGSLDIKTEVISITVERDQPIEPPPPAKSSRKKPGKK